jgi:hypothetical protein
VKSWDEDLCQLCGGEEEEAERKTYYELTGGIWNKYGKR